MEEKFSIERIREAQKSLFPDGGHRAVHEVRHRSTLRKFRDRLREDRLVCAGFVVILLLALLLVLAIVSPHTIRGALSAVLPAHVVRVIAGDLDMPLDRDEFKRRYEMLTEEEKRAIKDILGGY